MHRVVAKLAFAAALLIAAMASGDEDAGSWIGTYATSPMGAFSDEQAKQFNLPPPTTVLDGTVRYRIRIAEGGTKIRLSISNAYGDAPLPLEAVSIGLAAQGLDAKPGTLQALRFAGESRIVIPAGASALSDAVTLATTDGADLVASVYTKDLRFWSYPSKAAPPDTAVVTGDATRSETFSVKRGARSRPIVSRIDVLARGQRKVVVTLGDSITDGVVAADGERGWPGALARRLAPKDIAVVNAGIGGNRLLRPAGTMHQAAWARLDEDVFSVPGITHIIVLEGVNDIGMGGAQSNPRIAQMVQMWGTSPPVQPEELIAAYRQIIARAHARGVKVIGATILPFDGATYFAPEKEQVRVKVNQWIRDSKAFDGVIDFDAGMRDPSAPSKLRGEYDPGDHLHPNEAGYRAMGEMIDLQLFR